MRDRADLGGARPGRLRVAEGDGVQVEAAGLADDAERQLLGRDEGGALVDQRPDGGDRGGPDDLGRGDQCAEPVRDVDDVLPGNTGEEVLVATRDPHHLVREDRAHDQGEVVLDHRSVEQHRDIHRQPPLGQLGEPGGRDGAEVRERRRVPPLVVEHRHAGVGLLQPPDLVAEVPRQRFLAHRLVGAQGDQRGQPARPAVQSAVDRADQQGERAGPGAVGDQDAHAPAVDIGRRQLLGDEPGDLLGRQHALDATEARRPGGASRGPPRWWMSCCNSCPVCPG